MLLAYLFTGSLPDYTLHKDEVHPCPQGAHSQDMWLHGAVSS